MAMQANKVAVIEKLVSGGQTGVDRAALDAALAMSVACGGWCPRDRIAEDGVIDPHYPLKETPQRDYAQRTEWNVRDSDGTLILHSGPLSGGTALTANFARRWGRPLLSLDLEEPHMTIQVRDWIKRHGIRVLNVAGPRESKQPGVYRRAFDLLRSVLSVSGTSAPHADES